MTDPIKSPSKLKPIRRVVGFGHDTVEGRARKIVILECQHRVEDVTAREHSAGSYRACPECIMIDVTPEMLQRIAAFALALLYAEQQKTEEMARFFRKSAERHNLEIGRMVRMAVHKDKRIRESLRALVGTDGALGLIVSAWDDPVRVAVATMEGKDDPECGRGERDA